MPYRLELATATVAGGAATSPAWLPKAQEAAAMLGHPIWGELLAPLGVIWLIVQIGFFLYERLWRKPKQEKRQDV